MPPGLCGGCFDDDDDPVAATLRNKVLEALCGFACPLSFHGHGTLVLTGYAAQAVCLGLRGSLCQRNAHSYLTPTRRRGSPLSGSDVVDASPSIAVN